MRTFASGRATAAPPSTSSPAGYRPASARSPAPDWPMPRSSRARPGCSPRARSGASPWRGPSAAPPPRPRDASAPQSSPTSSAPGWTSPPRAPSCTPRHTQRIAPCRSSPPPRARMSSPRHATPRHGPSSTSFHRGNHARRDRTRNHRRLRIARALPLSRRAAGDDRPRPPRRVLRRHRRCPHRLAPGPQCAVARSPLARRLRRGEFTARPRDTPQPAAPNHQPRHRRSAIPRHRPRHPTRPRLPPGPAHATNRSRRRDVGILRVLRRGGDARSRAHTLPARPPPPPRTPRSRTPALATRRSRPHPPAQRATARTARRRAPAVGK